MKKLNFLPALLPVVLPFCLGAQSMALQVIGASGGAVATGFSF